MVAPNDPQPTVKSRFPLGQVVATPGALAALDAAGQIPMAFLHRHQCGDYGVVNAEDRQANERAIIEGTRILSAYLLSTGEKLWIITEADRSSSCLLLPSEY